MVKTGQFTTLTLRPYQRSHVAVDDSELYWYCCNGHLFRATVAFVVSYDFSHYNFTGKGLVDVLGGVLPK